jgi:hypothetical protein
MRTSLLALAALAAAALVPAPAAAQLDLRAGIRLTLPELPRLVIIQPGVQVVEDQDDEVFVHQGAYYARRDDRWYRARDRRGEFVVLETRLVPEPLRRLPPGHYRRYRAPPPPPPAGHARPVEAREHQEDKKEEKRHRKEEDRERQDRERRERDHDHRDGKGR